MNKKQDIRPYNDNGQRHGLWETYYSNGQLDTKTTYINGTLHGFYEEYRKDGSTFIKCNTFDKIITGYREFIGNKIFSLI